MLTITTQPFNGDIIAEVKLKNGHKYTAIRTTTATAITQALSNAIVGESNATQNIINQRKLALSGNRFANFY